MAQHRIRQFILSQLSEQDTLRYTDMRPSTMEASQFMYHLKKLLREGYVEKLPNGSYSLSSAGRLYVDRADDEQFSLREQPRLAALIICRHPEKGLLYMRRGVQPARGLLGFPIIDIPVGFALPLTAFVQDTFERSVGISAKFTHRGDGYINLHRDGELDGSLMAHIFSGKYIKGSLLQSDRHEYIWESELEPEPDVGFVASNQYVLDMLHNHQNDLFFFEQTFAIE